MIFVDRVTRGNAPTKICIFSSLSGSLYVLMISKLTDGVPECYRKRTKW